MGRIKINKGELSMAFIVNNFDTGFGITLPSGYYKVDHINWNIPANSVLCTLRLYSSKAAANENKNPFETENIYYTFELSQSNSNLINACYDSIENTLALYQTIEAAIAAYEADENNYIIHYNESGEESARELIPNDELYGQRFILPAGLEKLIGAVRE